jgi:hypothetical protein
MRFSRTDVLYRLRHSLCFVGVLCWEVGGGGGSGGWGWEWGGGVRAWGVGGGGVGVGGGLGLERLKLGKSENPKIRKSENLKI